MKKVLEITFIAYLFPQIGKYAMVAEISRKGFIKSTINGEWIIKMQKFIEELKIQADSERTEQQQATLRKSIELYLF